MLFLDSMSAITSSMLKCSLLVQVLVPFSLTGSKRYTLCYVDRMNTLISYEDNFTFFEVGIFCDVDKSWKQGAMEPVPIEARKYILFLAAA